MSRDTHQTHDETDFASQVRSPADAQSWIGVETPPYYGDTAVNLGTIQQFCAAVEDGNPTYWDAEFAERVWGGAVAPPAMTMVWTTQLPWKPGGAQRTPPLMSRLPLPVDTAVNVANETIYHAPFRVGDKISMTEHIGALSEEKRTRVGVGYFVTTVSEYRREDGTLVATQTNTLFRFRSDGPTTGADI